MDLAPEDLRFLSIRDILRESTSIPKQSPKTFSLVTLTLIFPLSLAIQAHRSLSFPSPFPLVQLGCSSTDTADPAEIYQKWTLILLQLCYLIFLFAFSLLSTAAVVFTGASLYTSKPVSISNTLSALPKVFKRLFIAFPRVSLVMVSGNILFVGWLDLVTMAIDSDVLGFYYGLVLVVLYLVVYLYATALWHLASVVSVLEPVYGFAALEKSYELLNRNTGLEYMLTVFVYFTTCEVIEGVFETVVVYGGGCYGVFVRIVVGGFLVSVLVIVKLFGLLLQSMFYFVCKSSHHEGIDKNALHEHLGEYVASQN